MSVWCSSGDDWCHRVTSHGHRVTSHDKRSVVCLCSLSVSMSWIAKAISRSARPRGGVYRTRENTVEYSVDRSPRFRGQDLVVDASLTCRDSIELCVSRGNIFVLVYARLTQQAPRAVRTVPNIRTRCTARALALESNERHVARGDTRVKEGHQLRVVSRLLRRFQIDESRAVSMNRSILVYQVRMGDGGG
jgi:hypothetical protein